MRVTFLDVGQGDAAVIEGPRGFVAVIDGGGDPQGAFDTGARIVEPYLRRRGIARIDLVALSHPHPDHLNGLLRIVERFPVGALWTSGDDGNNPVYGRLMALAADRGVPTPVPARLTLPSGTIEAVHPWLGDRIAAPPGLGVNDASLVLRVIHAGRSVLFSGDIEGDGEVELAGRARLGVRVAADVLKVPHHGSSTSSTPELLRLVHPQLAVASLGRQNQFRFPRPEIVARYRQAGIRLLRTDEGGAVTLTIDEKGSLDATCVLGCR
jgi:competence protein ComEC